MNYKSYDCYKKTSSWIKYIPDSWEMCRIKSLGTFKNGFGFPDRFQGKREGEIPFLKVSDINNPLEIYVDSALNYVSSKLAATMGWSLIPKGSILFPKIGVALLKNHRKINETEVIIDNNMSAFVKNENIDEKYMFYIFKELDMQNFVNISAIPSINFNLLKNFKIPITFDNKLQKQIANYLDKKTTKINSTIAKSEELVKLLEEKRVALINQAVTKGLNPDVTMKDSGIDWIGEIPQDWNIVPFKRLFDNIKDGTHGSFQRVAVGNPLLSAKNVFDNKINISKNESLISDEDYYSIISNGFPKKHDILLTIVGTIGRSCVYENDFPLAFQRSVAFIRLNQDNPYFYNYFIKSDIFYSQLMINAKESAQKGVYLNDIKECFVIRPPIEIQNEISQYLKEHTDKINLIIKKIKDNIALLKEYKTSLIHNVVTGKIDVRDEAI